MIRGKRNIPRKYGDYPSLYPRMGGTQELPSQVSIKTEPRLSRGRYPELLTVGGHQNLRIGVDFGTANTCASFVVVSNRDNGIFDYLKDIEPLHARNEQIRFPTVMAVKPARGKSNHGTVLFANDATDALDNGKIKRDHMIIHPKLGPVNNFDGIFYTDQDVLRSIQARHQRTLDIANTFDKLTVKYPGSNFEEPITLNTIDDAVVACLKYFLSLLKVSISEKLEVTSGQLARILEQKTEIGFAAPAFWTDTMLNKFLHLIQAAEWPSHCRIWSEPKCALAAHISSKLAAHPPESRFTVWRQMVRAIVICDVGSGTTDLATLKPKLIDHKTILFESVAGSGGSLCGGRLLDFNIENQMRDLLGSDLDHARRSVSDDPNVPIGDEDFFQGFDFDDCRKNFDGSKDEYTIRYRGNNLPSSAFECMTSRAIELSQKRMTVAHDDHALRVIHHIEDQILKTRLAMTNGDDPEIEILLIGGVTRAQFLSEKVKNYFQDEVGITITGSVEDFHRPLVAIGCILCLGQPTIGRRFTVKESYGIPISQAFDPEKHSLDNQTNDDETHQGIEARDLMDWLVMVGDKSETKVDVYDWSVQLLNDDGTPFKKDPRKDSSIYPLIIRQQIFSTTDNKLGSQQHVEYKKHPQIKPSKVCEISLSREECLQISKAGLESASGEILATEATSLKFPSVSFVNGTTFD